MKSSLKRLLLAVGLVALPGSLTFGATVDINNWYAINNVIGNTSYVAGGNTTTPVFTDVNSPNNLMVFSYFDSVNMGDGDKLSLTFDLTFSLDTAGATKQFDVLSFGLYNSSTPKASTTSYGSDRTATTSAAGNTIKGWSGFMAYKPGWQSWYPISIYQKLGDPASNYAGNGGSAPPATMPAGTGTYSLNFTDGVARTLTFELERSGDDLIFNGSLGATLLFSGSMVDAFLQPNANLFDAFGFYAAQGGSPRDTFLIDSATFTNVNLIYTPVPEPSTFALLAGVVAAAVFLKRRVRHTS